MNIYQTVCDGIGGTPLVALRKLAEAHGISARLLAKWEAMNPAGSAKDRVAREMLDDAEAKGLLRPGSVIVEPTSGNTGIGLAMLAAVRGYRVILTMPDTMSAERITLLRAYGAEIVLTEGARGMQGAIEKAEELLRQYPGSFMPGQFDNPAGVQAHYRTTGPEIWADTDGEVDVFVAGVGTGGTLTGIGRYLREKKPAVRIVAVEPAASAVLSGKQPGVHGLQGIGAGFIPSILDTELYDEVIGVREEDAYRIARELARTEGMLTGMTSGAALYAALEIAGRPENNCPDKTIVVLLPDSGDRYLTTPLYAY